MTPQQHSAYMTANKYHMVHSVTVLVASTLVPFTRATKFACYALLGGIVLFSFSIYALNLLPTTSKLRKLLGPVPPFGATTSIHDDWRYLEAVLFALKETERAEAERRAYQALRYQEWKNGEASEHINLGVEQK
ncbi:hypothetical protein MCAP1_000091 [Malassezia caprae]|uniref:Uncharacterized protein n=1 Tax=Malassezia caprae TaxID=1381934 RepID=A0AAF0E861_9BASI|nr:hypothetical protein MCAP1_000091 [Malassezia caprae]